MTKTARAQKIWELLDDGEHFIEGGRGVCFDDAVIAIDHATHYETEEDVMSMQFHTLEGTYSHTFPIAKVDEVIEAMRAVQRRALCNEVESAAGDLFIIFDGAPEHESGRFVEVEDAEGRSVDSGADWVERPGGMWSLGPFQRKGAK